MLRLVLIGIAIGSSAALAQRSPVPDEITGQYVYLSDRRIATIELIDEKRMILNYINLGDSIEFLRATDILVLDAEGSAYPGHLFRNEEGDPNQRPYILDDLVMPSQYRGYDLLGSFRFQAAPREVYLRLGSRVLELQAVAATEFDSIAERISNIDLEQPNSQIALEDAGFWQGFGELHQAGSEKAKRIDALLPSSEVLPPVVLANPAPRLPDRFLQLPDPVVVSVSVKVTRLGGMLDLQIKNGINPELDELALEVVRNSWELLPAISQGEPADAELVLRVIFER